jgi:F-type H+-transporting ATPase subunit gamma
MSSAREMRLRIRSIKNISQVTRALETVSASKVKRALQAIAATRPYTEKAWKVLVHLERQPGRSSILHPMLTGRSKVENILAVLVTSDRGLAGAYNMNILRHTLEYFENYTQPVLYITVGRKGRDLLARRGERILAEFSNLPAIPTFQDVSAIGRLAVDEYLAARVDQVFIAYTEFHSMIRQTATIKKLIPLDVEAAQEEAALKAKAQNRPDAVFIYEPDQAEILDQVIARLTAVQLFQAVLSATASEHAARMVAMRNATENAQELGQALQLEYNKARQQAITNEMLDIAGGAEALAR